MKKDVARNIKEMRRGDIYVSIVDGDAPMWRDDRDRLMHVDGGGGAWELLGGHEFPLERIYRQP